MNILSLFDGISCGIVALERANIKIDNYYASEIDKYAIQISKKNYPNIIQLGDINNWKLWNLPNIDLIIGGSPCQGFSNAGLGLNFNDPRSKLFFNFVDILKYYKPKYFLLENVKMKKEWQDIISEFVEADPIEINSALVSGQDRKRLYWTNIKNIIYPHDRSILPIDILEKEVNKEYYINNMWKTWWNKNKEFSIKKKYSIYCNLAQKAISLLARQYSNYNGNFVFEGIDENGNDIIRKLTPIECERLQTLPDNYTAGISNTQRYKCLGNGWTVDVIAHIFSFLPNEWKFI